MKTPDIRHRGSLMTYLAKGQERCLGYLFEFAGNGIFEPTFGRIEVSSAHAKTHNQLLSQAEIEGLDNCALGMHGLFYTRKQSGQTIVVTWFGEEVSRDIHLHGNLITFQRKGMAFRGRLHQNEDCFLFKRIPSKRERNMCSPQRRDTTRLQGGRKSTNHQQPTISNL